MISVSGSWVNFYGSVADFVVAILGDGSGGQYELTAEFQAPPDYAVRSVNSVSANVNTGETNYHIFSIELPEYDQEDDYIFTAYTGSGGVDEGGDGASVNPTFPQTVPSISEAALSNEPVSGLPTDVKPGESGEVAVQTVRTDYGESDTADVNIDPVLTDGHVLWTAGGEEIGEGYFSFSPDWENNDPFGLDPQHPLSTTTSVEITPPDAVGDYQFCVEVSDVGYYIPDDSEWHQPLDYRL